MSITAFVTRLSTDGAAAKIVTECALRDDSNNTIIGPVNIGLAVGGISSGADIKSQLPSVLNQFCTDNGVSVPSSIVWLMDPSAAGPITPVPSTDTRSIVTGTGATGFQVSSTKNAVVSYAASIVTSATLLNGAVGSVVLEIAPTNSATAGDWVEIGRITNGQVFSLAVAIGCTQTIAGTLSGFVPAGYYAKLRSINTTGTPSYSFVAGQKVLY